MTLCSFCGKSQDQVRKLVAGPGVYICDQCIDLCQEVLEEDTRTTTNKRGKAGLIPNPQTICAQLDQYVVGQDHAKKVLSVAVYNHYKRIAHSKIPGDVELQKSNILLVGPTGSGKTLLAQTARPDPRRAVRHRRRHHADRGRLRRRGRGERRPPPAAGRQLRREEGRVRHHLHRRDRQDPPHHRERLHHARRLRRGRAAGAAQDSRGHHVQRPAPGRPQAPHQEYIQVNTTNILFICGGAFVGLDQVIKKRLGQRSLGFHINAKDHDLTPDEMMRGVAPEDLIKYGMIPEFIGRLPINLHMKVFHERAIISNLSARQTTLQE